MFPKFTAKSLVEIIKDENADDIKIYNYFKDIDDDNLFEKNHNQIPLNLYSDKNMFFHMNIAYTKDAKKINLKVY